MKAIFLAVFIFITFLSGCSDETSKAKGTILSGCLNNGGNKAACNCVYDKLEAYYGKDRIKIFGSETEMVSREDANVFLNKALEFALICRKN